MKNNAVRKGLGILAALLIVGTISGGNWKYLADWSTGELVGYNLWTLLVFLGGGYLVYRALSPRVKK